MNRLEEALKENERLRGTEKWLDQFVQELQDQVKDFQQQLEERDSENEKLKKEIRQKALDEMARLTQEIEEPSEVNRLWRENKKLRQRIAELEK